MIPGACAPTDTPYVIIFGETCSSTIRMMDPLADMMFTATLYEVWQNTKAGAASAFGVVKIRTLFIIMVSTNVVKISINLAKLLLHRRIQLSV